MRQTLEEFTDIMRRAIEMAAENVGRARLADCAQTLDGITLDMSDAGTMFGVKLGRDGGADFIAGAPAGGNVLTITTTKDVFHRMAYGTLNPGIAYARGDVRLSGVPILKLRGMDPIITAIFRGYRAASEGIEFEAAAEAPAAGGILEEMLGAAFTAFDGALRTLDRVFGAFGAGFFYEKSLNRIESLWNIVDREMRRMLAFGRETEEKAAGAGEWPAAGAKKTLQERLRERIASTVEAAVSEITRTAASGYLVKRLIVPGSFRNFQDDGRGGGFEVKLRNKLGVATVIGFSEMKVDGESCGLDAIEITKGRLTLPASEVSDRRPLLVSFGDEMLIRVRRDGGIAPGRHRISLGVDMVGIGGVDVDYEETLAE